MKISMIEHSVRADPMEFPCCPVCDQPIYEHDIIYLQSNDTYRTVRIIHGDCAMGYDDEDDEDDDD